MKRIGIDLGTTNTVASTDDHVLGIGEDGVRCLPSVVAFLPNGNVQTGDTARRRRSIDGINTIFSSKRIIGRRFSDGITREFCARYPFEVVDTGENLPAFRTRAGDKTPTEIASVLLGRIQQRIEPLVDDAEVVITVPAGFASPQRDATCQAARSAGFGEVRLVDEPTATAFAYRSDPDVDGIIAVFDLGGGTFDVSVLDCGASAPRVLARGSDPFLGGDDIDCQIADWVTREVLKQHNWDLANYAEVQVRLLAESERAKLRLTEDEATQVDLTQVDPECPAAEEGVTLRREVMERLAAQLMCRAFVVCDSVLHDAGVRAGDLRAVLLAGGSTHMKGVQDAVEAYFGRTGRLDLEPTEVVARGASLASDTERLIG